MSFKEIWQEIYSLYSHHYNNFEDFNNAINRLEQNHNSDIKEAFMFANLRLLDVERFKVNDPVLANLLCYIAIEAVSNKLAYFKKTQGKRHSDFEMNYKIEKKINKTREFQQFICKYSPKELLDQIKFKKIINDSEVLTSSKDALRYLYQRHRSIIIHEGVFRTFKKSVSLMDMFIDEEGKKCVVTIKFLKNDLVQWLSDVVRGSFINFLDEFKN